MKCPLCGSQKFYVKDPEDEYEIHIFSTMDGTLCFDPDTDASSAPAVGPNTETYCNQCAWHGKLNAIHSL